MSKHSIVRWIKMIGVYLLVAAVAALGWLWCALPEEVYLEPEQPLALPRFGWVEPLRGHGSRNVASTRAAGSYQTTLALGGWLPVKTIRATVMQRPTVMVCGTPFGVKMFSEGALVVGFSEVHTAAGTINPAKQAGLRLGDRVIRMGDTVTETNEQVHAALEAAAAAAEQAAAARTATAAALAQQLTDAKQSVPGDLDALRARQTELQAARGQAAALEKALTAQLVPNRSAAADYRRLADARQTLEARWQWVNALAATAGGTLSSKQKIRLEAYIQMHYLDRILVHANTRLMQMTAGQYELERVGAENQRSQSGLDLGVIDHYNGTRRSVKTLSGGESFKASLALALGLSDEVQRTAGGIRLDTLFLDEGFGSLDDESLEQAIRVLSSLTEGDRLVGIISHVAALKDRIDRQVLVKKARSGGSTVELVV